MTALDQQLPSAVLARTIRVAALNGWGVAIFSTLAGITASLNGDAYGAAVCALVALFGLLEYQGGRMLRQGKPVGLSVLVASQLLILSSVLGYTVGAVAGMGIDHVVGRLPLHYMRVLVHEAHMTPREALEYLGFLLRLSYGAVALTALFYHGGMAIYFGRRQRVIDEALKTSRAGV